MTSAGLRGFDWAKLDHRFPSESGVFGRRLPLPTRQPWVPGRMELDGDALVWYPHSTGHPVVDARGMLDTFLRIKSAKGVLRFAQRFGVLGICEHGLPYTHPPSPGQFRDELTGRPLPYTECRPLRRNDYTNWEPLRVWFHRVDQAAAILRVAAALDAGKAPSKQDWQSMIGGWRFKLSSDPEENLHQLRMFVGGWLHSGHVTVEIDYLGNWPSMQLHADTFGTLAVQLVTAINKRHMVACSGCGLLYERGGRMPQRGRRNFCPQCGETVASRLRKREERRRKPNEQTRKRRR